MAQEFVRAAAEGEIEVSQLAVLNPDIWERVQEIEREKNLPRAVGLDA
jgi:hypothetical protein